MKASDECSDFFSLYIYDNNDINKEKMITIIIIIIKVIIIITVPVITMRNKGRASQKTLRVLLLFKCKKKEKARKNFMKGSFKRNSKYREIKESILRS